MVIPESIVSATIGFVISSAQKAFADPRIERTIDQRNVEKELKDAILYAIDHTEQAFTECFVRDQGPFDESFWKRAEVRYELWNTLTDSRNPERIPDFNNLYKAYCEIYEESARIERPLFDKALQEFWTHFLDKAKQSQVFAQFFKDKILFQLDKTVFPHEGRQMMAEYCQGMAQRLEDQAFHKFRPRELDHTDFSEKKVKEEFLDYRRTTLTYVEEHDGRGLRSGKEQAIEGDSFLHDNKIIFIGPGGVGKTRFMFELVKKLVAEIASASSSPTYLPLYLQAAEFVGATEDDLIKLLKTRMREVLDRGRYPDKKIRGFVRYLQMYGKLFPVIDAFDQIRPEQEDILFRLIATGVLFGKCKTYLSTRPYKLDQLKKGIDLQGADSRQFRVIEIQPFEVDELPVFFKDYHERVKPLIDRLAGGRGEMNLIQLPLFARLVKIMAIKGRFMPSEAMGAASRATLMRHFVDFVVDEQSEKDKIPDQAKEDKLADYREMLKKIEHLSLKTLEHGQIYTFDREYAQDILGKSFRHHWPRMERIGFINKFFDYESEASLAEPRHRFQHQIFQEYFAARELYTLCRTCDGGPDRPTMRAVMETMKYMPEVGHFFAELIEEKATADDFVFWQDLVTRDNQENWVRTYALEVRDRLGERKARDALSELLDAEDRELRGDDSSGPMVHIPAGGFVRGSYDYEDEGPVCWVTLDDYEIDRHPVTNAQFIEFLTAHFERMKSYKGSAGEEFIYFDRSKIAETTEVLTIKGAYEDHPVVGVTWYGAQAYCKWKSALEQAEYRLPTETEWEKVARGCLGRRYPWGNEFAKEKCNTVESEKNDTSKTGSFPGGRSPYGCHDMAGNVWEWCQDDYESDFYEKGPKKNPVQTESQEGTKLLRGGSWNYYRSFARCADRNRNSPDNWNNYIGFRCAGTL
jgi:formylglycine-generating enzyme required for sulfatase activity